MESERERERDSEPGQHRLRTERDGGDGGEAEMSGGYIIQKTERDGDGRPWALEEQMTQGDELSTEMR